MNKLPKNHPTTQTNESINKALEKFIKNLMKTMGHVPHHPKKVVARQKKKIIHAPPTPAPVPPLPDIPIKPIRCRCPCSVHPVTHPVGAVVPCEVKMVEKIHQHIGTMRKTLDKIPDHVVSKTRLVKRLDTLVREHQKIGGSGCGGGGDNTKNIRSLFNRCRNLTMAIEDTIQQQLIDFPTHQNWNKEAVKRKFQKTILRGRGLPEYTIHPVS